MTISSVAFDKDAVAISFYPLFPFLLAFSKTDFPLLPALVGVESLCLPFAPP
jgi:hypothetical protein